MTNYIAFGCWNKIKDDKDQRQEKIIKYLENEIKKNKFRKLNFLTLLGDNYYPNKVKVKGEKQKEYNESNLFNGFRFLEEINLPKIFIHGNHDITDFPDECQLVQMGLTNTGVYTYKPIYPNNVYPSKLSTTDETTLYFFLDSTIYDKDFKDDTRIEDTCYKHIFPKFSYIRNIKKYQIHYVKLILDLFSKKNIVFHFHHPILSKKQKKSIIKTDYNEGLIEFYNSIKDKLNGKNIYHICADTHFYENSYLDFSGIKINQYIVGTGGADLDTPLPHNRTPEKERGINYTIIDTKQNYGFLHIDSSSGELQINFIAIPNEYLETKSENKYLKYKLKYSLLKKLI
jgi:hypothetical protein